MKRKVIYSVVAIVLSMVFICPTFAIPLIGIDTDPLTIGRQTSLDVLIGDIFTVEVVVEGIEALSPLAGFEFDISFDSAIIDSLSITSANSLPAPVISTSLLDPEVELNEVSLSFFGPFPSGDFSLASISFQAIGLGTSVLDLNDTVLSDDFGFVIAHNVSNGNVNVVPEPATLLLMGAGLAGLGIMRKKRI